LSRKRSNNDLHQQRHVNCPIGHHRHWRDGRGQPVKGEDERLGLGVSYCATYDAAFFRDPIVAVAGNGDEAITAAHCPIFP
jgi:alkyl hydroperoxide reductase subunit AhpF